MYKINTTKKLTFKLTFKSSLGFRVESGKCRYLHAYFFPFSHSTCQKTSKNNNPPPFCFFANHKLNFRAWINSGNVGLKCEGKI